MHICLQQGGQQDCWTVWQRPCAINSCTWHGSGSSSSSSSLSVQACQDASLFSVIIIFLLTATGTESGWFLFFFFILFLLLFFGFFFFVAAAAASFGSGFLAEITRDPRDRELQTQTDNSYASEMSGQYLRQGRE